MFWGFSEVYNFRLKFIMYFQIFYFTYSRGPLPPRPVRNRAAQQEVSGEQVSEASSATPHRSPSLALPPEPSLALLPESSPSLLALPPEPLLALAPEPSPSIHGKIVFYKTGPWCQTGWEPLTYSV